MILDNNVWSNPNCPQNIPKRKNKPTAIIAHTIKGKGISFMEDDRKWHTMIPSDEEYSQAMIEFLEQEKKVEERIGK